MKIDRNWFLIAIMIVLASILLPFMQAGSFAGNVVESEVVYRDGWFGPYIERVMLDNGGVMHVIQYPWYYFTDGYLPSMNIYGIEGSGMSNTINIVCYPDDDPIPIVVKQQNDLKFPDSIFPWLYDEVDAERSRLTMYNGIVEDFDEELNPLFDSYHDMVWSYGPYEYEHMWTSTLHYYPYVRPYAHSEGFTIEETLYPALIGYDMDRAFVYVTVLERVAHIDPDDPTSPVDPNDPIVVGGVGSITVRILDDLVQRPATIHMYQDNVLIQTVYIENGEHTFDDLEFGFYRFEVVDDDYETYFYDAFPQQSGYDYDLGNVELSAELNGISCIIYGDFPSTEGDGFDFGDGLLPVVPENNASEFYDDVKDILGIDDDGDDDDGSLSLTQILGMIAALLTSMGLLTGVAVIGLPIFMVGILFLLGVAFVKSGDKTNYSPGNNKGGRKR